METQDPNVQSSVSVPILKTQHYPSLTKDNQYAGVPGLNKNVEDLILVTGVELSKRFLYGYIQRKQDQLFDQLRVVNAGQNHELENVKVMSYLERKGLDLFYHFKEEVKVGWKSLIFPDPVILLKDFDVTILRQQILEAKIQEASEYVWWKFWLRHIDFQYELRRETGAQAVELSSFFSSDLWETKEGNRKRYFSHPIAWDSSRDDFNAAISKICWLRLFSWHVWFDHFWISAAKKIIYFIGACCALYLFICCVAMQHERNVQHRFML